MEKNERNLRYRRSSLANYARDFAWQLPLGIASLTLPKRLNFSHSATSPYKSGWKRTNATYAIAAAPSQNYARDFAWQLPARHCLAHAAKAAQLQPLGHLSEVCGCSYCISALGVPGAVR